MTLVRIHALETLDELSATLLSDGRTVQVHWELGWGYFDGIGSRRARPRNGPAFVCIRRAMAMTSVSKVREGNLVIHIAD